MDNTIKKLHTFIINSQELPPHLTSFYTERSSLEDTLNRPELVGGRGRAFPK